MQSIGEKGQVDKDLMFIDERTTGKHPRRNTNILIDDNEADITNTVHDNNENYIRSGYQSFMMLN